MKNIIVFLLGWILYINYRIAYSILIHRPVLTMRKFSEQPKDENTTQFVWIILFDMFVLMWFLIGFWWTVLIWFGILMLNYAVFGVYKLLKK